jgi:hypothetical protein
MVSLPRVNGIDTRQLESAVNKVYLMQALSQTLLSYISLENLLEDAAARGSLDLCTEMLLCTYRSYATCG